MININAILQNMWFLFLDYCTEFNEFLVFYYEVVVSCSVITMNYCSLCH